MENLFQDIRFSLRLLRKNAGFTTIAVLTLALGIGVNTAMFGSLNGFLLRPFPFREADRLVMVWEKNPKLEGIIAERLPTCLKNYVDWQAESKSFEQLGAYSDANYTLTGSDKPEQVTAEKASANFFEVLGVRAVKGRPFAAGEGAPGRNHIAVLGYTFYEKRFGKDSHVLDRSLLLNGVSYKIIGVLPRNFRLTATYGGFEQKKPDLWVPLDESSTQAAPVLQSRNNFVLGRLKPGVSLEQARAEMNVIGKRLEQKDPGLNEGFGVNLFNLREEDVGSEFQLWLLVLQSAVGFVLLIACANIANLLLARAAGREKEIAVRMALGAGRGRIIRQVLAESLVLSLLGGVAGLLLAEWDMTAINRFAPTDFLGLHTLSFDVPVFGFTSLAVIFAAVVFGSVPAVHAVRQDINQSLTRTSKSVIGRSGKLRSLLVVSEVALALVLLIGAGLMVRSLNELRKVNPGFVADHLLTAIVRLSPEKYKTPQQVTAFNDQLLEKVKSLPGVKSAALASGLPLENIQAKGFHVEGQSQADKDYQIADYQENTADYFTTMGSPILRGRPFTQQEVESASLVIIVNEALANRVWPNQNPLGKALMMGPSTKPVRREVVGVVADTHQLGPDVPSRAQMFAPSRTYSQLSVILRTSGDPLRMSSTLTNQVLSIDKEQPVTDIQSMDEILSGSMGQEQFGMSLMVAFAGLALALASVGLYGVLAYVVTQRTQEIGIRMALGAQRRDVLRMVVRQGMMLSVLGVAIGLGVAVALSRVVSGMLFGISARDPLTFGVTAAVLLVVALVATYIPAWRATRVDPMIALRYE